MKMNLDNLEFDQEVNHPRPKIIPHRWRKKKTKKKEKRIRTNRKKT
jgi:hypothetical protein